MNQLIAKENVPSMPKAKGPAESAYESLAEQIKQFEAQTKEEEVVGAILVSFAQSVVLHVHRLRLCGQMCIKRCSTVSGKEPGRFLAPGIFHHDKR